MIWDFFSLIKLVSFSGNVIVLEENILSLHVCLKKKLRKRPGVELWVSNFNCQHFKYLIPTSHCHSFF